MKWIFLNLCWITTILAHCYDEYADFCRLASQDEAIFARFKREPVYTAVLEHVSEELGEKYLAFILAHYPDLAGRFDLFRENDRFGSPVCFAYLPFGSFSPTTLRYIKVAGDLRQRFGDLSQMHILEIGGGYGGQCKIIHDLGGFASYTIVDLPSINLLSKKYLRQFNISNVFWIDSSDVSCLQSEYDLLISNYAFLEFQREEQEKYFDAIGASRMGYITGYFPYDSCRFISEWEFFEMGAFFGFKIVKDAEVPLTAPTNCIITWVGRQERHSSENHPEK